MVQGLQVLFPKVKLVRANEFHFLQRGHVVDALHQEAGQEVGRVVVKDKGGGHQGTDVVVIVTEQGHLHFLCFTMGCEGQNKVTLIWVNLPILNNEI